MRVPEAVPSSTVATNAAAVTGPTPGMVVRGRANSWGRHEALKLLVQGISAVGLHPAPPLIGLL